MEFRIPSGMVWALALLAGLAASYCRCLMAHSRSPTRGCRCPTIGVTITRNFRSLKPEKALRLQQEPATGTKCFGRIRLTKWRIWTRGPQRAVESEVPPKKQMHRDWAFSMSSLATGTATTGSATTYPAKFGFDANAAPDCVNDYVAFNTSLPGASGTLIL